MIEQFFRPDSVEQALELKRRYQDEAVWFACGQQTQRYTNPYR